MLRGAATTLLAVLTTYEINTQTSIQLNDTSGYVDCACHNRVTLSSDENLQMKVKSEIAPSARHFLVD